MSKKDIKIAVLALIAAFALYFFRGMIMTLAPFILIVGWLVLSIYLVNKDKKNGKVTTGHKISLILSIAVTVIVVLLLIYVFFIMPNPFAR